MSHIFLPTEHELSKQRRARWARRLTQLMALALAVPVGALFAALALGAAPDLSWSLIFDNPTDKGRAGGLWAPLIGTFTLVVSSVAIVTPLGVGAAIYLNEYARDGVLTRLIGLAVTSLAGVPSIVHALFGLGAFVLFAGMGASIQAAACTIAVMNLPVVIAASREALASVPRSFREACWNLGASRWQTIRTVVLPNAWSGILTGVILAVSRAAGEAAPILFTGAVFFKHVPESGLERYLPYSLQDTFMAMAMHLHVISTQVSNMPESRPFAAAFVLLFMVLCINAMAIAVRVRLRSHRRW